MATNRVRGLYHCTIAAQQPTLGQDKCGKCSDKHAHQKTLKAPTVLTVHQVMDLAERLESALLESRNESAPAVAKALDPSLSFEQAQVLRQASARVEHETMRQVYGLDQIASQEGSLSAEQAAAWEAGHDTAVAARHAAAALLRKRYPALVYELTALLRGVIAAGELVDAANAGLPPGKAKLERPDGLARNFPTPHRPACLPTSRWSALRR